MPVRSLNSSVFRWPNFQTVDHAVRRWAEETVRKRTDILRIGYIGSYARGDWGVGSDLDLIIIVERCVQPLGRRILDFDLTSLPVPTDLLVYTKEEWKAMTTREGRFCQTIVQETVWVYENKD